MIVELVNIQSIRRAVYDIPEVGITRITGDNSNGKSILFKAMAFIAKTEIKEKDKRKALKNRNSDYGRITVKRNGMILEVVISLDISGCSYTFTNPEGKVLKRTIREGGMEVMAEAIGFITFDSLCLQIRETFGIFPFINNGQKNDCEIVDKIITDKQANAFVDNFKNVTYPAFKEFIKVQENKEAQIQKRLDSINFYDIDEYKAIYTRMNSYYKNMGKLSCYTPSRLPITKGFRYIPVEPYTPVRLPIKQILPSLPSLHSLIQEIKNLNSALDGVCPLCGLSVRESLSHTH